VTVIAFFCNIMFTNVLFVQRLTIPASCPQKYSQLMSLCWNTEPKERPNFYSILTLLDQMSKGEYCKVISHCLIFISELLKMRTYKICKYIFEV